MQFFIRKCFSGISTPIKKSRVALEPIDFPFSQDELKIAIKRNNPIVKSSNLALFVK